MHKFHLFNLFDLWFEWLPGMFWMAKALIELVYLLLAHYQFRSSNWTHFGAFHIGMEFPISINSICAVEVLRIGNCVSFNQVSVKMMITNGHKLLPNVIHLAKINHGIDQNQSIIFKLKISIQSNNESNNDCHLQMYVSIKLLANSKTMHSILPFPHRKKENVF